MATEKNILLEAYKSRAIEKTHKDIAELAEKHIKASIDVKDYFPGKIFSMRIEIAPEDYHADGVTAFMEEYKKAGWTIQIETNIVPSFVQIDVTIS